MKLGMIGLGRMGLNMTRRLLRGGHEVVVYNRSRDKVLTAAEEGAVPTDTVSELVQALERPRIIWLMLPAGQATEEMLTTLGDLLDEGDLIVEGGNTHYKDDIRRYQLLAERGIGYMDAGVSGGIWGLDKGYCTMVGGEERHYAMVEPLLATLAPQDGYLHCGAPGAGHFIKMIHNGIEYGMMQAYAEGFELIQASPYAQDLGRVSHLWNQGSVVRSWLLELAERAFLDDPGLESLGGYVEDSGEGRWTVQEAVDSGVAAPVITAALYSRFLSRQKDAFSNRVLAALRNQFGGHMVARPGEAPTAGSAGAGKVVAASADPEKVR